MSTIVGTNIEVTNLKYDSDTTSMIISNTGQVTIQGEGTNTTSLQQGLSKAWISHEADGTPSAHDSFNHASLTDVGTGNFKYNFTNNFNTAKGYTNNGGMAHYDDHLGTYVKVINPINSNDILTSSVEISATYCSASVNGIYDYTVNYHSALGDLA